MSHPKTTAQIIKEARLRRGMTQQELADKLGVSLQTVSKYERGVRDNLQQGTVDKFAKALGVSPAVIMGWETIDGANLLDPNVDIQVIGRDPEGLVDDNVVCFPSRYVRDYPTKKLLAVEIHGDSLKDLNVIDGDVAIFVKGKIDGNGLYAISVGGNVEVKRLEFDRLAGEIVVRSENSRYEARRVKMDSEALTIEGKVVGWIHHQPS